MKAFLPVAMFAGLALGAYSADLHWNNTPSMPRGLWHTSAFHGPAIRGETVIICLPEAAAHLGVQRGYLDAGDCPGRAEALIKTIAAIPGDAVAVREDGITINGVLIEHSKPLPHDDHGQPLEAIGRGTYRVGEHEVWIVGSGDLRSFDSRYFGPVPLANIRRVATAFLVSN
jgi:conjugative transfer signal peptidase TraF